MKNKTYQPITHRITISLSRRFGHPTQPSIQGHGRILKHQRLCQRQLLSRLILLSHTHTISNCQRSMTRLQFCMQRTMTSSNSITTKLIIKALPHT